MYSGSRRPCTPFRLRGFHPLRPAFPKPFCFSCACAFAVRTPRRSRRGLGSSGFARRYSRNRCFFLFLRLLRCFSSPGSPPCVMDSRMDAWDSSHAGFPIQTPADHRAFAPPRSFSQLVASFIGSQCQGIHPAPFLAWPLLLHSVAAFLLSSACLHAFLHACLLLSCLFVSRMSICLISFFLERFLFPISLLYGVFKVHASAGCSRLWRRRDSNS